MSRRLFLRGGYLLLRPGLRLLRGFDRLSGRAVGSIANPTERTSRHDGRWLNRPAATYPPFSQRERLLALPLFFGSLFAQECDLDFSAKAESDPHERRSHTTEPGVFPVEPKGAAMEGPNRGHLPVG